MGDILATVRAKVFNKKTKTKKVKKKLSSTKTPGRSNLGHIFYASLGGNKTPKLIPQHQVHVVNRRYAFVLEDSDNIDGSLVGETQEGGFRPIYRIRTTRGAINPKLKSQAAFLKQCRVYICLNFFYRYKRSEGKLLAVQSWNNI